MKNHRVINVKTLPATNTEPCRIRLTEDRFQKADRKTIYFSEFDNTKDEVLKYLLSIGINIVGFGSFKDCYYFFSDTWSNANGFKTIKGTIE